MTLSAGKDITLLCNVIYQKWTDFGKNISLSEMRIINKIFHYYDNDMACGHKELVADLNIPSSVLSKLLKIWLNSGFIKTKKSDKDKRRNFYYPSEELLTRRDDLFNDFKVLFPKQ